MLTELEFDIQTENSLEFLHRYLQLFRVDEGVVTGHAESVRSAGTRAFALHASLSETAKFLCKVAQRHAEFLSFKPSQVGAAALTLAMNSVDYPRQFEQPQAVASSTPQDFSDLVALR